MLRTARKQFLSVKDEIRKELDAGATMRAVYVTYAAALGMSYAQFRRYVGRFLPEAYARVRRASPEEAASPARETRQEPLPSASPTVSGGTVNAERQPVARSPGEEGQPAGDGGKFRNQTFVTDERADELLGPGFSRRRR